MEEVLAAVRMGRVSSVAAPRHTREMPFWTSLGSMEAPLAASMEGKRREFVGGGAVDVGLRLLAGEVEEAGLREISKSMRSLGRELTNSAGRRAGMANFPSCSTMTASRR